MGGFNSGNERPKRQTVSECERLDAIEYGAGVVRVPMPEKGFREYGTCPNCGRAVKYLYRPADEAIACRQCHGLSYDSTQQWRTPVGELRANLALLGEAYDHAGEWLTELQKGRADAGKWNQAMRIFDAASDGQIVQTQLENAGSQLSTTLNAEALNVAPEATLQERVIVQDVVRATQLMEHVERLIEGQTEAHVSRAGVLSQVPMRVDSLAKLGNLYVALSNMRATRAGIATEISATRSPNKADSYRETLLRLMDEENYLETMMARRCK